MSHISKLWAFYKYQVFEKACDPEVLASLIPVEGSGVSRLPLNSVSSFHTPAVIQLGESPTLPSLLGPWPCTNDFGGSEWGCVLVISGRP